jgi:hypothetical protein
VLQISTARGVGCPQPELGIHVGDLTVSSPSPGIASPTLLLFHFSMESSLWFMLGGYAMFLMVPFPIQLTFDIDVI